MSKEKRRVPKLRFPGFTEDWEQCKLDELTISIGDGLHGTPKYDENGSYYFINGNNLVDSKVSVTAETKKVAFEALSNDDRRLDSTSILMSINGTIGTLARYNIENIMLGKSVAYITPKNINRDFLFYQLQGNVIQSYFYKNLTGTTIKNLGLGTIKNAIVMSTLSEEESKIGQFFYKLDQFITLHQRKLDNLKLKKKALLQKLFPKNGERYPELRFPEFTDAWEQREFSDIFAEVKSGLSRMLSNDDIGLPVVRANNINDGQLNLVDDIKYWYKNDPQGANTNNYLIEQGDILINFINSEAKMGTAAYVTRRPERDTIYTTNILRCKVNDEYNPYFIYSLTFLNSYKNYIASITKPAVNQASFTTVDFKKYSIKIPTVKEQNQIADLIETFNKLITLHQRKLDHLQLQKKALLQQMFV